MIKPMLAAEVKDIDDLDCFPLLVQRKMDGVRAIWDPNKQKFFSRNGKEFRNVKVNARFKQELRGIVSPYPLDGELCIVGKSAAETFGVLNAHIANTSELVYYVFDVIRGDMTCLERTEYLYNICLESPNHSATSWCQLMTYSVNTGKELYKVIAKNDPKLAWEGVMLKTPEGRYKHGRSTLKEALCYKIEVRE